MKTNLRPLFAANKENITFPFVRCPILLFCVSPFNFPSSVNANKKFYPLCNVCTVDVLYHTTFWTFKPFQNINHNNIFVAMK